MPLMERMKEVLPPFLELTDVCSLRSRSNDVKPMSGEIESNYGKLCVIYSLSVRRSAVIGYRLYSKYISSSLHLGLHSSPNTLL